MLATLLAEGLVIGVRALMSELGPGCVKTQANTTDRGIDTLSRWPWLPGIGTVTE